MAIEMCLNPSILKPLQILKEMFFKGPLLKERILLFVGTTASKNPAPELVQGWQWERKAMCTNGNLGFSEKRQVFSAVGKR